MRCMGMAVPATRMHPFDSHTPSPPRTQLTPPAFNEICDGLTREILAELGSTYEMPAEALEWVKRMIDYNVKGGKLNRGLTVSAQRVHTSRMVDD